MNPAILLWAYTITMFISATLLFLVQPIIGKILIPFLGGAPSVWNTCMVFFQAVLLFGYLYAHGMSKIHPKHQLKIHLVILVVTGLMLPITSPSGVPPQDAPLGWLLLALLGLIGAPFFAVSTTAPLLQSWFSHSTHPTAKDPYHLYAASNLGSMTSLLGYPFLIEPFAKLQTQTMGWSLGFGLFAVGVTICGFLLLKNIQGQAVDAPAEAAPVEDVPSLSIKQILTWILLAFIPSSLVLGTTTYITMDVASVPLLWLVPLALYLLTFILVFSNRITLNTKRLVQLSLLLAPLTAIIEWSGSTGFHMGVVIGVHLALLFTFALTSHALLAERRPHVKHLTAFFLWMSFGGVLGGAFNGLLAPFFFRSLVEYWLIMALAVIVFIYPWHTNEDAPEGKTPHKVLTHALVFGLMVLFVALSFYFLNEEKMTFDLKPFGLALLMSIVYVVTSYRFKAILCAMIACGVLLLHYHRFYQDLGTTDLHLERSFFGVHRVYTKGKTIRLGHGTTFHGSQNAEYRHLPTTYYSRPGPLGQMMKILEDANRSPKKIAAIGLGAGTVATYATPTRKIDFYEIDPVVAKIAKNPLFFTYLQTCGKQCEVYIGDGRLKLQHTAKENSLDMIILDAYSSDAIPVHLSTKQALDIYWGKLKNDGIIAFHISNRHFDLKPVLAKLAEVVDAKAYVQQHYRIASNDKLSVASSWVVMGRKDADVEKLFGPDKRWKPITAKPGDLLWTDSYSNLLGILKD